MELKIPLSSLWYLKGHMFYRALGDETLRGLNTISVYKKYYLSVCAKLYKIKTQY